MKGRGRGTVESCTSGAVRLLRALKNKSQRHFAAKLSIFSIFRSCLKLLHSSLMLSLPVSIVVALPMHAQILRVEFWKVPSLQRCFNCILRCHWLRSRCLYCCCCCCWASSLNNAAAHCLAQSGEQQKVQVGVAKRGVEGVEGSSHAPEKILVIKDAAAAAARQSNEVFYGNVFTPFASLLLLSLAIFLSPFLPLLHLSSPLPCI